MKERACPFCHCELAPPSPRPVVVAARLGRAAVFAGATLAGSAACWTDGKTPQTTPIEHTTVETKPMTPPAGTIRGVIRNGSTGAPLAGLSVMIQLPGGEQIYATSNERGVYEFSKLPPGEYVVEYHSGNPREAPLQVPVTLGADAGALADVRVVFPEPDRGPCCKPYGAPPARRRIV